MRHIVPSLRAHRATHRSNRKYHAIFKCLKECFLTFVLQEYGEVVRLCSDVDTGTFDFSAIFTCLLHFPLFSNEELSVHWIFVSFPFFSVLICIGALNRLQSNVPQTTTAFHALLHSNVLRVVCWVWCLGMRLGFGTDRDLPSSRAPHGPRRAFDHFH